MRSLARREGRRGLAGSGKEFQGGERERVVEEPGRAGQESLAGSGHGGADATAGLLPRAAPAGSLRYPLSTRNLSRDACVLFQL
jgi:hypothetical protein